MCREERGHVDVRSDIQTFRRQSSLLGNNLTQWIAEGVSEVFTYVQGYVKTAIGLRIHALNRLGGR